MWLQLELDIGVGERSQKIKAEDVSVEKTRKTCPVTDRKELNKKNIDLGMNTAASTRKTHFFLPKLFFGDRQSSNDM